MCEIKEVKEFGGKATPPEEKHVGGKKKYYCQMDYPLCMEKYHWNWIWLGHTHIFGIMGFYMFFRGMVPLKVFPILFVYGYFAGAGTTMGAHRLWAHKTYKANLALKIILAFAQTASVQYPIFKWCRDHRLHHKYVETDADPHNALRGFFFSHVGWLLTKEHPAVKEKEDTIDMSDLDADPVVRFQTKFYWVLVPIAVQLVPGAIVHYFLPDIPIFRLFCLNYAWYTAIIHGTFLVNSAAHFYGYKPYDKSHAATENSIVSLIALGEGTHNYHHVFPWDYKTAEFGNYGTNWTCLFIDFFARLGWAWDLKTVPSSVITQRILRTGDAQVHVAKYGDGARFKNLDEREVQIESESQLPAWGWGDKDIPEEHYKITQCLSPSKAA